MLKMILFFLLLLLSLVQYRRYFNNGSSCFWDGTNGGITVLAIICFVFLVQIARGMGRVSKAAGLDPAKRTPYSWLPWLFLIPLMFGLRYLGDYKEFPGMGYQYTWEFQWGQSGWKILLMVGLVLALYLNKLKKRIAELEKKFPSDQVSSQLDGGTDEPPVARP